MTDISKIRADIETRVNERLGDNAKNNEKSRDLISGAVIEVLCEHGFYDRPDNQPINITLEVEK
jgi:hypothetical protein